MPDPADNPDGPAPTSTSRSLLARLHANEPAAWDRLVALYAPLVWHWGRRMNLPRQDAADVLQEVFQAVAQHITAFHKTRPQDTFRGWLRTITRNKIIDHRRRQDRQPRASGGTAANVWLAQVAESELNAEDPDAAAVEGRIVHRALESIRPEFEERTWRAFWRTVIDGQSAPDAARDLGMTAGAVRVAKCRVLNRLRRELGDLGP